jgi:hypothetical protein
MIDTVRYYIPFRFRQSLTTPHSWKRRQFNEGTMQRETYTHTASQLVAGSTGSTSYIEVSLPRLLYPNNARLIASQGDLDRAVTKADNLLAQIATDIDPTQRKFTRVDLVAHVWGRIGDFIEAHEGVKHPEVHKWPSIYPGETILWRGSKMSITIYDKYKEMTGSKGKVVRVEIRLRDKKLQKELAGGSAVKQLNYSKCYRAFRRKILQLAPAPVYRLKSWQTDVLYLAMVNKWRCNGKPAWKVLLKRYSPKQANTRMRELAAWKLAAYQINWSKLLPLKHPPRISPIRFIVPSAVTKPGRKLKAARKLFP